MFSGGISLLKRRHHSGSKQGSRHHSRSNQEDEELATPRGLRSIGRRQRWVLEGTYLADTGEAPATMAVFGTLEESARYSKLLHDESNDVEALKQSWQDLESSDIDLFVRDAQFALEKLRKDAKALRDERESG